MAKQIINTGTAPNSGTGDPLRSAFTKINENFTELYNRSVFSGSYNDLTNKPVLFSGSYNDLTNKPTVPTDINQLTDTGGLLTSGGTSYNQSLNTTNDVVFKSLTLATTNVSDLEQTYLEYVMQLEDLFAQGIGGTPYTGVGTPASKLSYEALIRAQALNPLIPANWIVTANALRNAYYGWAAASVTITPSDSGVTLENGDGVGLRFEESTGLRFPDNTFQTTAYAGSELGDLKISGSTIGTIGSGSGWGDHDIYLSPNGESYAWIHIPNDANTQNAAPLIVGNGNNSGAGVHIRASGFGWEFKPNAVLQLPAGGDILDSNGNSVLGGSGLTNISGAQIGNQITISTTIDGATPDLVDASSIDYIPTTTLEANDWINTGNPNTYSSVRFADGSTFLINGWNTDNYPNTGNGTSGFISLDASGLFYTGAQVWPITITSYDYVAGSASGRGISVAEGVVWKFDESGVLTLPGEIQSINYDNLILRSKDNINLYAGNAPGDDSEGGDINIYAGQGDPGNGGGDVQIRGGQGGVISGQYDTGNTGGYVQLQGGYSIGSSNGGYVELRGGNSDRGRGGNVDINGGYGSDGVLKLDNVAITAISLDTPVRVTLAVDHNLNNGDAISFGDILTTVQLNNKKYYVLVVDNNAVTLFQDRALTIPVSGTGMTEYSTQGIATVTATSVNAQQNNYFTQYISNAPEIGNVQVGWTVTGPGLNGTKTVTSVDTVDPVVIVVDGSDGSVFNEFQSYTFVEPSTTGLGTAYSSSHGGDITLQPGSTYNSAWGDIGRTLIRGETQIGNESGNIWKFGVDGKTTFPTLSVDLHNGGVQSGQTLQFADPTKQAIISGPAPTGENDAQRLIIQGHRGTGTGEGGDVYLWAGDSDTDGGDIKIYAGDADASPGNGGYINIDAGNGYANGGDVTITAGSSAQNGGDVRITAGTASQGASGRVEISSVGGNWIFGADGNLTLPSGSIINETSTTTSITPPGAVAGQSLVIRPTSSLWSVTSSGNIVYGSPITISVNLLNWAYFGTVNYEITGPGVTEEELGRPLTGNVVFTGIFEPDTQSVTWTIPANSNITEFTFTLTSVNGTRSTPADAYDPALYYNFEDNALPTGNYVTVGNNSVSNSEANHVHLISGNPLTTDIYLGDDDQYVKIEKNGGDVVIGTDTNINQWTFGTDGTTTFPNNTIHQVNSLLIKSGIDTAQVGSSLTIADDGSGGLVGWNSQSLSVAYDADILSTFAVGDTITFQDGVVATITGFDNYGPAYIDIFWDTPKTGTLFPITLKTDNYVPATIAPEWEFGTTGSLTFPGAVVKSTVAKNAATTGTVLQVGASPSNDPLWPDGSYFVTYGGDGMIQVLIAGNTIVTIEVVTPSSLTTWAVGDSLGTVDGNASLNGGPSIVLFVDDITPNTVALDLTKTVNKLSNGNYTLADGVEGQIMYLVRQTGATYNAIMINVSNARVDGALTTTIDYYPFETSLNMSTLIFTDGAWQASNGGWD